MNHLSFSPPQIEAVETDLFYRHKVQAAVLRLDRIHPVISGNKWYKLKEYLHDAQQQKKKVLLTSGGAYSNHIVATAAACKPLGLHSIGIIRGDEPAQLSPTLADAQAYGMQLFFISRAAFAARQLPAALFTHYSNDSIYVIPEGGYGHKGREGAQAILAEGDTKKYTHICCAVGTGTMLAGLAQAAEPAQQLLGITVLKNNYSIEHDIRNLLTEEKQNYKIRYDFHFGGYAKYNADLLRFMNDWYRQTGIPTDFVYTAKLFYGVCRLVQEGFFEQDSNVLIIHSGGVQGNRSLPKGTLIY